MTNEQKSRIAELRQAGFSYAKIGEFLDIPKNTIKTYCNRNSLASTKAASLSDDNRCKECGSPLTQKPKTKQRIFCCDDCRRKWWKEHPENLHRKTSETLVCTGCGREFSAYEKDHRKYCSHSCYIKSRFGGDCYE